MGDVDDGPRASRASSEHVGKKRCGGHVGGCVVDCARRAAGLGSGVIPLIGIFGMPVQIPRIIAGKAVGAVLVDLVVVAEG